MYARVVSFQAQPDKFDVMLSIFSDSIYPAAQQQEGFAGTLLLSDRDTGRGMTITLWDTEADLIAGETSAYFQEQIAKVGPYLTAQPETARYEVNFQG
jgi:heme-degrading monooxygenase HmoA